MEKRKQLIFLENSKGIVKTKNKNGHLYVLSSDEIKKGDYIYCTITNAIEIAKYNHDYLIRDWKKVIATTDTSLYIHQKETISLPERVFYLPQPSQQFIQKYIEEYNRGNIITDVLVEYLESYTLEYYESAIENKRLAQKTNIKETLKVNPKDNTITIKKAKDSYTREEVENLIYTAMKDRCYTTIAEWKKWIKENL